VLSMPLAREPATRLSLAQYRAAVFSSSHGCRYSPSSRPAPAQTAPAGWLYATACCSRRREQL